MPYAMTFTVSVVIDPDAWEREYGDRNVVDGIQSDLYSSYEGRPAGDCGAVKVLDVTPSLPVPIPTS